QQAIELLSKAPLAENGTASARARLLLAHYLLEVSQDDRALETLESVDLPSAASSQKLEIYKMKAELYRQTGRYGHAIDQYINIEALPGLPAAERAAANEKIEALQNEALSSNQ